MARDGTGRPVLAPETAQEIARDITGIVGFNVLITDREAIVIGSGDPARIGTLHEASVEVLATLRPQAHDTRQARGLHGVRPGISLPLVVDGEPLGTVGLTGPPSRVRQFGLVVQRQAEILIRESERQRSLLLRERAVEDLLRELALPDPQRLHPEALAARAAELGVNLTVPRRALLIDLGDAAGGVSRPAVLRTVREVFAGPQDLIGEVTAGRPVVLHPAAHDRSADDGARLVTLLADRHGLTVRVGVGDAATGPAGLHASYRGAEEALRIGPLLDHGGPGPAHGPVLCAPALRVPRLLAGVPQEAGLRYAAEVLGPLRAEPDWPTLRATLIGWAESGCHLVRAAEQLHIHRNTLVYRLDKITRRAGRPVRDPAEAIALYLACLTELVLDPPGEPARPPVRHRRTARTAGHATRR
ncbi:CdaR family transcriptional regulator [Streptomyces sp. NPDC054786]